MIFDFADRFQAAFGFVASNTVSRLIRKKYGDVENDGSNYNLSVYNDNEGTFDEILLYRDTNQYLFAYRSIAEQYSDVFATPPMLSLKRSKKLAITPIDNTDYEAVERYTTEPWEITWRGLLIDMENHEFPIDKMEAINKIFEVNGIWNVSSEILQKVGVEAVYVKDLDIDFVEGYEDTIAYTMMLRAIKPLEYQLIGLK